jgi:hypothetical protein
VEEVVEEAVSQGLEDCVRGGEREAEVQAVLVGVSDAGPVGLCVVEEESEAVARDERVGVPVEKWDGVDAKAPVGVGRMGVIDGVKEGGSLWVGEEEEGALRETVGDTLGEEKGESDALEERLECVVRVGGSGEREGLRGVLETETVEDSLPTPPPPDEVEGSSDWVVQEEGV